MLGNKHWIPTKIKTSDERLHTIHRYCSPMYYIPYFMSDLWNNTQIIDQSISSKFSYTHRNFGLLYLNSKICILHKHFTTYFDLIVSWYSNCYLASPFFMHLEYKNNHTYLLLCTATVLLNFSISIRKQKQNTSILQNFIDWRKLLIYLMGAFT